MTKGLGRKELQGKEGVVQCPLMGACLLYYKGKEVSPAGGSGKGRRNMRGGQGSGWRPEGVKTSQRNPL